jgi:hypothetical protein
MRQASYRYLLLPLFLMLACVGAFAQANSQVTGIVTDQTGAVIAGANVTLTDPDTGFTRDAVSGPTGLFVFGGLNPSNYNLKAAAKGFQTYVQTGITVNVSGTFRVDVKLTLGSETQTISVVADALAVQTDTNVISTLITSEELTSIATANRNFAALAALGLGVSSQLPDNNALGAFGSNWSIEFNGLRQAHNIWLIDGGESADRGGGGGMQILPSQEAIAEFQTMTSNYPPDYGISSGATISLSLKSGTKSFHGAAWEENRATAYNANTWMNKNGTSNKRPATHYNIYGFDIGGPIYIPHTYNTNKNKGFFFFSQEWRKTSAVASSDNATIPAADIPNSTNVQTYNGLLGLKYVDPTYAAAHGSAFTLLQVPAVGATSYYQSHDLGATYTAGACFQGTKSLDSVSGLMLCPAGQVIPKTLFDTNAQIYLNAGVIPAPNVTGSDHNVASVPLPQKVTDTVIRGDYNFNDKWALLVHFLQDHQNQNYGQPELGWCGCNYNTLTSILTSPAHSATVKLTGTLTPNLLVEAVINYDGNGADIMPSANTYLPTDGSWTVQPVVDAYKVYRKIWPNMNFGNTLGGGKSEQTATEPYHNAAQDYAPKVDVSYTKGKHQMKFGFSYNRYTKNQMMYSDAQGTYNWNQLSGFTLMDVLLGLPSSYTQAQQPYIRHYYNQTPSAYAMDNWHVTPRLTLQLGIRYDAMPHTQERQNLLGNFNQDDYVTGAGSAPVWNIDGTINASSPTLYTYNGIPSYINGTVLAGQQGHPRGTIHNDYRTLQPRIGFSEDLSGNGKTVIRGGFGTFYERFQGNDVFDVATSAPFNPALSVGDPYFSKPGTNYSTGNVIAPTSLIFAGSANSVAQIFRAPAVAMYSLGVQHEIKPSVIWVAQYVGNMQWHQNIRNNATNSMPTSIGLVNIALNTPAAACSTPSATCVDARQVAGTHASFNNIAGMNAYRKYPGYAGINQDQNTSTGNYNGLQTAVRIQNRWGLSGEIDYTYSHIIDIQSTDRNNIDNPWYIKYDKGSGTYDRRHILQANYVYNLPIFNKSQGLLKSIAGGWQIAGTFVKETGMPQQVNLNSGTDPVGLGGGYQNHPNITNSGVKLGYPKKGTQWFDVTRRDDAITPVWAGGTNLGFGNWGKDTLVLPGRFNLTTSIYKSFQIYEQVNFQLKFESFNTLNHPEWNAVDTTTGKISGTNDPRNLQLGGKFNF